MLVCNLCKVLPHLFITCPKKKQQLILGTPVFSVAPVAFGGQFVSHGEWRVEGWEPVKSHCDGLNVASEQKNGLGGFKYFLFSSLLGEFNPISLIFFKGVGSTTNQKMVVSKIAIHRGNNLLRILSHARNSFVRLFLFDDVTTFGQQVFVNSFRFKHT